MKQTVMLILALLMFSSAASAARIISFNVDEGGGRNPMGVSDVAGANSEIRVGNWNNFRSSATTLPTDVESPTAGTILYSDGTAVDGSFSVTTTGGTGYASASSNTNDALMYVGFFNNSSDGAQTVITLTNIPFAEYDIYVYAQGQNTNVRGGTVTVSGGPTYYGIGGNSPDSSGDGYVAMTTTSLPADPSTIAFGNYAVFPGLTGSSETITATSYLWGDFARQQVYGFQIVEVPEPATLGLLAVGGLAMLKRRKK